MSSKNICSTILVSCVTFIVFAFYSPASKAGTSRNPSHGIAPSMRQVAPVTISLSDNQTNYVIGEEVSIEISVRAHTKASVQGYLAFRHPDGSYLFYDGDNNSMYAGDPADRTTWTPYSLNPILLKAGAWADSVNLFQGGFSSPGQYSAYAIMIDSETGADLSNLGVSFFRIFRNRVKVTTRTIHVGDEYDSYMHNWEVPQPMGTRVSQDFFLDSAPTGEFRIQGAYFATYYSNNPVYLNGVQLGFLPGGMNGNSWHWTAATIPARFIHEGRNVLTFGSYLNDVGHYDDYMIKSVEIFYN